MSRLPAKTRDQLDDKGQALWDQILETRGADLVGEDGGFRGPFNAFVYAPEVGRRLADLGGVLRFKTSVDRRLLEMAIITIGAHWKAEFEWWAHSRMAREFGISDAVIDAVQHGRTPTFEADDERVVHEVALELATTGHLLDATYQAGVGVLGEQGMFEITALCGYYTLISFLLNAFEVPLPPRATPAWSA
jgi:4-carboxymuconolactone decarboxylase